MKKERIPKRSFVIWEILSLIGFGLIVALVLFVFKPFTIVWYIILWVIGALSIFVNFLYLPLLYLSYSYGLSEKYFVVSRGVFMHKTHYMELKHISFVSLYTSPFTNWIKLSSLVVTAPGGRIVIMFMDNSRALDVVKALPFTEK